MAEKEKLAIRLKNGVAGWNAWRRRNPELVANLGGANLIKDKLSEADLSSAYLNGAASPVCCSA